MIAVVKFENADALKDFEELICDELVEWEIENVLNETDYNLIKAIRMEDTNFNTRLYDYFLNLCAFEAIELG